MQSDFSEWGDPSYVSSSMCPEYSRKEWRTRSFGIQSIAYTHEKAAQSLSKDLVAQLYISDLSWSRLGEKPAELFEIAVDREVFRALLGLLSRDPPQRKTWHENE